MSSVIAHRDHVARDDVAATKTGVEASGDDVDQAYVDGDLDGDLRIFGEEARQYRCQREFCHRRREREAQMPGGPVAECVDRFDRRIEPVEQRAQLAQHALARFGKGDAARRAIETPSRSSSDRTVWLKVAVESPSRLAALVKLASSATATKALSSANCVPRMGSAPWATAGYQPALPLRSVRAPPARVDIPSGALLRAFVFTGSREAHHHVIIWTA